MARRRRPRGQLGGDGDLDLTSLLDVIFNLIFFFVVATSVKSEQTYFDLTLPQASQGETADQPKLLPEIYVSKEGALALNGESVTAGDLTAKLKELTRQLNDKRVVFSADAEATVQQSVDAMDLIRAAGITEVIQRVEKRKE